MWSEQLQCMQFIDSNNFYELRKYGLGYGTISFEVNING